ncbi:FAD-dependent monooxygenase andE [Lasiodiplodia hormozganensis]|uniref:FAD-dependent monooxygenase andE n=1 Tax=Lasiodiplodia hormozganensis TaxID=869390 RepID=A0AA39Z5S4_9PEZI|nr:FAD-dependent monooxygenase andE [Lasiodiplodia hormozganensis]
MATHNFKVLIAGGSIAGLVLAITLEKLGIDFLVLEAHPEIAPQVGASIGFFPNGCRILDQIGCYDDLQARLDKGGMVDLYFKSPKGVTLDKVELAREHFIARHGYEPVFVDRQMALEVFYDHLRDKSKVLLDKRVLQVTPLETGVQVTTKDGSTYTGDILVGADGIHSTVRKEMWRLGDKLSPAYFPKSDQTDVPCDYTCMFGISSPVPGFARFSSHSVAGHNHSYLVVDGPEGRIYWFLFVKNEKTLHGMENEIPRRFSEEEKKAVAEKFWNDPIVENVTFGDLYKNNYSAILTALPEFVFSKFFFQRIITIGDAAHKFNPISGQGGNSAIESAATLATELVSMLKALPEKSRPSDADITAAFQKTQDRRRDRLVGMVDSGHKQQSLMALETPLLEFLANHVIPLGGMEGTFEHFATGALPGERLPMFPMPKRPRFEPYHDERPAKLLGGGQISKAFAASIFAILLVVAKKAMWLDFDLLGNYTAFDGAPLKAVYTGLPAIDDILKFIVASFSDSCTGPDPAHPLQFVYLLSTFFPFILIWTIESYRRANTLTLVSLPFIFGLASQIQGIGVIAPLYFLLSVWTTSRTLYTRAVGRPVPTAVAHTILPAALLGYVVPTILMFLPYGNANTLQSLIAFWQPSPLWVSALTYAGKRVIEAISKPTPFDMYAKADVQPLRRAYGVAFWLCATVHVAVVAYVALSSLPSVAFANVFGGLPNPLNVRSAPSFEEHLFVFLKFDFAFSASAAMLWCLYSVWELRRNGWATTKEALVAAVAVLGGQVLVGPAAVFTGLWWWREGAWAREAKLEGRGDE